MKIKHKTRLFLARRARSKVYRAMFVNKNRATVKQNYVRSIIGHGTTTNRAGVRVQSSFLSYNRLICAHISSLHGTFASLCPSIVQDWLDLEEFFLTVSYIARYFLSVPDFTCIPTKSEQKVDWSGCAAYERRKMLVFLFSNNVLLKGTVPSNNHFDDKNAV